LGWDLSGGVWIAIPEGLLINPPILGATGDEIFVDTTGTLNYSPASLPWLCYSHLLRQPGILLTTAGPSDPKAEPVSPEY